ncbi:hypothetical protein RIF29_17704 [Crotalaria pallida]|uniref:SHSP domain-containing protein n=1 Tax=Crotalaria pallida TaxID=3830 RepID=A0AAN9FJU7_CROPI
MSLDQKAAQVQPAERVYEDFEPPHDWVHDETSDTLILMLPGFRREQLRVQIASTRILRLSGERQMSGNKWRQFRKEFPIPQESDTNGVSAKFENGILYIKLPKLITPIKPTPTPTPPPPPTQQQAPRPPQLPTQQETPKPPQQPTPPNAQEAKTEKISKPPTPTPTPTPIAPQQESKVDEESQKKPKTADKAVETKAEKAEEAPAATPAQVAPLQKNEVDDSQKKAQKEKAKLKSEATTSKAHHHQGVHEAKIDKRSQTLELLSRQTQEYTSAAYGLVEELKKQKKLANLLVGIILAFVFGLYVKHAIKSSFGGPKIEEL